MDVEGVSPLQQLADERIDGGLRAMVERLRREGLGWRPVAAEISVLASRTDSRINIGYETLRGWAERGGWNVDKPSDQAAS